MSSSSSSGCGCFAIAVLFLACAGLTYPIYDGYINRELPAAAAALKQDGANIAKASDGWYLSVPIGNDTDWIIDQVIVSFTITVNGKRHIFRGNLSAWGSQNLNLSPANHNAMMCFLKLPSDAALFFERDEVQKWEWRFESIKGRRPPIRLIKKPVDGIKWLFGRDNNS